MIEPKIEIWNNEFATSYCYPTKGIVHHQFHQFFYGETFREIMTREAEVFEEQRCTKWLSDDRKFGPLHPDDKEWGDANWAPRVIKAGWKHFAMVLPEKVTGQMNLTKMVEEFKGMGIIAEMFSDPKEALDWLIAQ